MLVNLNTLKVKEGGVGGFRGGQRCTVMVNEHSQQAEKSRQSPVLRQTHGDPGASSPTLSSSTVTVFSARIESDSGDRTYDRESTKHEFRLHTDTFNAMSTTSLQNSYTSATSCKCSFLLLPLPHQPVAMLNNQRTFLLIIVFSQQQQESHVKRHHC